MSLIGSDRSLVYAPQIEAFAGEISDEDADRLRMDPVARSTALQQAVDLVGPDWIVVSEDGPLSASTPDGTESPDGYDFGEPATAELAEVVEILSEVRSEPIVARVPDPLTLTLERFGEEWIDLLESDEFAALETLHEASRLVSDVLRAFEGNCSGIALDASGLADIGDGILSLEDYLLELGPVFNLADHHNVSVIGAVPAGYVDEHATLADEFDLVVFDSITPSALADVPDASDRIGCTFPDSFWETDGSAAFRDRCNEYLDTVAVDGLVLMQYLPPEVEPEYVQILGDVIETRR